MCLGLEVVRYKHNTLPTDSIGPWIWHWFIWKTQHILNNLHKLRFSAVLCSAGRDPLRSILCNKRFYWCSFQHDGLFCGFSAKQQEAHNHRHSDICTQAHEPILLCCATCYFTTLSLSERNKFLTVTYIFPTNNWSITSKLAPLLTELWP